MVKKVSPLLTPPLGATKLTTTVLYTTYCNACVVKLTPFTEISNDTLPGASALVSVLVHVMVPDKIVAACLHAATMYPKKATRAELNVGGEIHHEIGRNSSVMIWHLWV